MGGSDRLRYFHGHWPTNKGAWFPGETVRFRDKALFEDFADASWMTLMLYGINGRMPDANQSRMIEKIWSISSSFPDPRLWNNRVAALAGTVRSTGSLALAAATGVTEATIYGSRPVFKGAHFLHQLRAAVDAGESLETLVFARLAADRVLPGFGRPVTTRDERVEPLLREAARLGFGDGPFLNLVRDIEKVLRARRHRLNPNIAIYCAALFSDLGYSPSESYMIAVLAFSAGMIPCYLDALEKPEGCLFPLDCASVRYDGHAKRRITNDP
ncbi:MAG: citrate/2-methylcitrate synthase [Porticoccaceae bacterium]